MGNEYKAILRLKQMIDEAKIPYISFTDDYFRAKELYGDKATYPLYPAYCLRLTNDIDVIENNLSLGNVENLLEIKGALTEDEQRRGEFCGFLTAEEVFKRFKYCYEHNTNIYRLVRRYL